MSRVLTIAKSEFLTLIRGKAFLVGIVLMPVLFGTFVLFMKYAEHHVDLQDRSFAVIDHTGVLYEPLAAAAAAFNAASFASHVQTGPRYLPTHVVPDGRDPDDVKVELSARVRRKELFAFVEIPASVLAAGAAKSAVIQYHTETISYEALPNWLTTTLDDAIATKRFVQAGIDQTLVAKLTARVPVSTFGLIDRGADGKVSEAREVDQLALIGPPMFFLVLMFLAVMTSAQHLLTAIIEEKMSRISEVLLGSVTPFQLLLGKLVGVSGVSVLLVLAYFAGAVYAVFQSGRWDLLNAPLMAWFVLFLICAALMYGAIFLALGSACSSINDAQSLMQPAMLLLMLAYVGSFVVVRAPDSVLAVGMSFIPTMTPFAMMLRMAIPPGAPSWQVLMSVVLLVGATAGVVWAAGRIFRVGILMQGKAPNLPELLRWIRT
jgi:ABC-2 type transport system permease protein